MRWCKDTVESPSSGELAKLSASRFLSDIDKGEYFFSEKVVKRTLAFIAVFKHFEGSAAGQNFVLQPWQIFIVANIVGWYHRGTTTRRFTYSYIEVARKNGKTFLSAALCLYFLIADGESGAEVDLAANCKEQAKIAFRYCTTLSKQLDETGRVLKRRGSEITYMANESKLKCFAADSTKLDGFNASFGLVDEYHAAINSNVRDVIKSSQAMRPNPHLCTITTAGFSRTSPCYEYRKSCVAILRRQAVDDSTFAIIFAPDEGDDWRDPQTWRKANPNLGVTVREMYLQTQVTNALNNPTEQTGVKTKNLNIWTQTVKTWIDGDKVQARMKNIERVGTLYVGVDLAAVGDLAAVSYLTAGENGELAAWVEYYVPAAKLENGKWQQRYNEWHKSGYLNVTEGNVTDYDRITADLMGYAAAGNNILLVSYDSWNATQWAITATALGLPLQPYSQTIGSFNKPTRELERRILGGGIMIDYNPITLFCFDNVSIKTDVNGNVKPYKDDKESKIDGVIALCMALGGYLSQPQVSPEIFVI